MTEAQPTFEPKENELTEECRELICTLPMEKSWVVSQLYQYQGFWYRARHLQGALSCQKHFEAHDTDILVVTTPKSGTTWLKAWTFALLNRNTYPNIQNHPLLTNNPHALVPFLEVEFYHHKDSLPDLNSFSSPRLFSAHLPYVSLPKSVLKSTCKIVYLCRDPKDTFISFWHYTNSLRPECREANSLEEAFENFCRGVSICGPCWDHILGYWKESLEKPQKIMFMRFEEMKMKPAFVLKELARFMGCPFSKEEETAGLVDDILKLCSFDNLSHLEVNRKGKVPFGVETNAFFRRGQVGDWKNHLTVEMIEQLNAITEKKLAEHGLRF